MVGIRIDWSQLEVAFESHNPEIDFYLDRHSGKIHAHARMSGYISEEYPDLLPDDALRSEPARYIFVEPIPSREQYRMMERFIETITLAALKERLGGSIVGKGAFRRFKDIVSRFPEERKRWFHYRDIMLHQYIFDWLRHHKLALTEVPDWSLELPHESAHAASHAASHIPSHMSQHAGAGHIGVVHTHLPAAAYHGQSTLVVGNGQASVQISAQTNTQAQTTASHDAANVDTAEKSQFVNATHAANPYTRADGSGVDITDQVDRNDAPNLHTSVVSPVIPSVIQNSQQELEEFKSFLLAWGRAHGEEFRYLFTPAAFERLCEDLAHEYAWFRRFHRD